MQSKLMHEAITISDNPLIVGQLVYNAITSPQMMVMLIGPHPLMGGSMDNNIIKQLTDVLADTGYLAMRFNYGPMDSKDLAANMAQFWQTGQAPCDPSLIQDARWARDWMMDQFKLPIVILGYSFGAHVGMSLFEPPVCGLVMIAPTVAHHDIVQKANYDKPKIVIYTNNDFASPQLSTESWFADLAEPKKKLFIADADHFFKQQQEQINQAVKTFLLTIPHQRQEAAL